MTSMWAALFAEALVVFVVAGIITGLLRSRLREGGATATVAEAVGVTSVGAAVAGE